ncbi:PR-1-like protein [Mycena indigotica]|uniref:PR-1-like protein n=1 Tax=Mycena indigotica TaxID=2126181 RepID=A0A8H6SP19_9AGAR|nr:PR-1-like protein [Mycena indigotica]KAF7303380.1 PR-1-like protein [Mycena indigotica]
MAGPRPRSLPLLAVLLAAALLLLPAVLAHGDHKGAHYGRKRTRNGRPARPFAKGRPTANVGRRRQRHAQAQHHRRPAPRTPRPRHRHRPPPSSTPAAAPPPPPPPPPPAPTSTSSTPPRRPRPTGPRSPGRINARARPSRRSSPQRTRRCTSSSTTTSAPTTRATPSRGNDTLSAAAQKVADTCVFEHSGGKAIVSWTNGRGTTTRRTPCRRTSPRSCGGGTTQVGCALTVCAPGTIFDPKFTNTAEYYVCEYAPPGNIIGQFDQMVSV